MLKRFSVENFASFNEEQSLDLTAGRTELLPDHVADFDDVKLLRSAVIYGANASGKSNLIKAIDYAKKIITGNLDNIDTYKKYFRLSADSAKEQTSFEFEIEIENIFFSYGFSALLKNKEITEEWLYKIGKGKPELFFQRKNNEIELGNKLKEKSIKSRFEIYADDMKNQKNQLFLTEIANKDLDLDEVKILSNIYNWFDKKLIIIYPDDIMLGMSNTSENFEKLYSKYLKKFDTGVVKVDSIDEDFEISFKDIPDDVKNEVEKLFAKDSIKESVLQVAGRNPQVLTTYKNEDGDLKVRKMGFVHGQDVKDTFELKDESDGTRRLLDLIPLVDKFTENYTVIIDEFDRSLHPQLSKEFFKLFYDSCGHKSQLIVTTHESTLLDLELVRRDEIWFVERGKNSSSSLYSLNKFKLRYDSKVEKAYLLGRYGAIPVFKSTGDEE